MTMSPSWSMTWSRLEDGTNSPLRVAKKVNLFSRDLFSKEFEYFSDIFDINEPKDGSDSHSIHSSSFLVMIDKGPAYLTKNLLFMGLPHHPVLYPKTSLYIG